MYALSPVELLDGAKKSCTECVKIFDVEERWQASSWWPKHLKESKRGNHPFKTYAEGEMHGVGIGQEHNPFGNTRLSVESYPEHWAPVGVRVGGTRPRLCLVRCRR